MPLLHFPQLFYWFSSSVSQFSSRSNIENVSDFFLCKTCMKKRNLYERFYKYLLTFKTIIFTWFFSLRRVILCNTYKTTLILFMTKSKAIKTIPITLSFFFFRCNAMLLITQRTLDLIWLIYKLCLTPFFFRILYNTIRAALQFDWWNKRSFQYTFNGGNLFWLL